MKPFFVFCLFLSVGLHAQTLPGGMEEDSVKVQNMQELVVKAWRSPAASLLSMPSVTLTKEELEIPSFFTPADALQREAGVSLIRDGIWATSLNIRGLSKERILILTDGERVQTATDLAAALSTIDLNSLKRIEIIKGAASVLHGTGAMGGTVNFITERPAYTGDMQVNGRAGSGFNTVNKLWTNHAKVQVSDNNWYLGVNGSYRNAQNTQTPAGILDNSQFEDWSVGLQGGMIYSDSQELLVNYQHYAANNVGIPGGETFPAAAKVRYKNIQRNHLSGEYIFREPGDYVKELRIKAYTQNFTRDVENRIETQKTTVLPSSVNVTSGAKIIADLDLLSPYRSLKVGAEGWLRNAETKRYKVKETGENAFTVTREQPVPNAKMLDLGVFAQYSWEILPSKLTLDAGVRLDYIRTQNDSAFNPVSQYEEVNGEREDLEIRRSLLFAAGLADEFSYAAHVDLIYRPARHHKLMFSLSNAYRAASLEERFKYIDQLGTLSVGNPHLKPEQGGFSNFSYQFAGERFHIKADVFANYLFNLVTPQLKSSYATPNGEVVPAFVNTNIDEAFFIGAELEAGYRITNNLRLTANAGYTRGRDVKNNEFLPQIPPLKGMAELNYQFKNFLKAAVSTCWATKQNEIVRAQETVTDGYAVLNASLQSGKIQLQSVYLQLFAGMDNILNTEYYNHINTTRGIVRAEPGRNFYLKAQFEW